MGRYQIMRKLHLFTLEHFYFTVYEYECRAFIFTGVLLSSDFFHFYMLYPKL